MAEAPESEPGAEARTKEEKRSTRASAKEWLRRMEPGRRQRSGIVTAVLVAAIVGGIGVLTWPKWKRHVEGLVPERSAVVASGAPGETAPPKDGGARPEDSAAKPGDGTVAADSQPAGSGAETAPPSARTSERLSSIAARLDLIVERIGRLEAKASRPPPVDMELRDRVDGIATSLAALDKRLSEAEASVAAVQEASRTRRADALALAVGHLRAALSRGAPYPGALAGLRSVGGRDKAIRDAVAILAPRAEKGIPSLSALQGRFDAAASATARAALAPQKSGWFDRTMARLSNTVTVRRTGEGAKGNSPGAIVARAEAMVARGELEGAVRELSALEGAPARAMAAWLGDARARVAADGALATLTEIAISRIAAAQKVSGGR